MGSNEKLDRLFYGMQFTQMTLGIVLLGNYFMLYIAGLKDSLYGEYIGENSVTILLFTVFSTLFILYKENPFPEKPSQE